MAAEALDIKSLTSLFLASPKSDIIQAVGRILREKHSNPLIIDLIDNHDVFLNQFTKRRAFYNEKNYKIIRTNEEKYNDYIKYLKSLNTSKKNDEITSILAIEEELILNITNQEVVQNLNHTSILNFWNYLLFKSRKNNKNKLLNNSIETSILNESKCLILL